MHQRVMRAGFEGRDENMNRCLTEKKITFSTLTLNKPQKYLYIQENMFFSGELGWKCQQQFNGNSNLAF